MATNKKKIFVTESMSNQGRALLHARDDIELVEFPNMISARDFEAKLKEHAPVHGVALGGTRFGETELDASKDIAITELGFLGGDLTELYDIRILSGGAARRITSAGVVELLLGRAALTGALGRGALHQVSGDPSDPVGCLGHVRLSRF